MAPRLRCAIYTRKSSDEGLEQSFNSLHAQREACEAYVLSQAGEGWIALAEAYDDGGFSGGDMDRPALRRLLADIAARKIDVVVVYKVDRLTRSLADFAKIVEAFDARDVSFVSVTQAFNTTSSMGRLTLNVLLSFAQFEREVTGERIRDKIAASKAKGMWMGGFVPLGYDLQDRRLVINPAEAQVVVGIFERYLQLGSAKKLAAELAAEGVRSKAWTTRGGKAMGGLPMRRGAVFYILQNRLYLGETVHKGQAHPGQHEAIVPPPLFDAVAAKLAEQAAGRRTNPMKTASSPLTGIIFDATGEAMSPSFSYGRGGRPYRYYIARNLQVGGAAPVDDDVIRRVSASGLEAVLLKLLVRLSDGRVRETEDLRRCLRRVELRRMDTHLVVRMSVLLPGENPRLGLAQILDRLEAGEQAVWEDGTHGLVRIVIPRRMQLRGGRTSLSGDSDDSPGRTHSGAVKALRRAHADLLLRDASPLTPIERLSGASAPDTQHDRQVCRMAFLSPEIQRQILTGRLPLGVTVRKLLKSPAPLAWADQTAWLQRLARA